MSFGCAGDRGRLDAELTPTSTPAAGETPTPTATGVLPAPRRGDTRLRRCTATTRPTSTCGTATTTASSASEIAYGSRIAALNLTFLEECFAAELIKLFAVCEICSMFGCAKKPVAGANRTGTIHEGELMDASIVPNSDPAIQSCRAGPAPPALDSRGGPVRNPAQETPG